MKSYRLTRRSALTLLETLVVVGIIGILMAMLLPAMQKVREAYNRTKCANNEREIGIAAHNFAGNRNSLPPAVQYPYAMLKEQYSTGAAQYPFGPNWAVLILPFIEQGALYKEANVSSYPGDYQEYTLTNDSLTDLFGFQATGKTYDLSWRDIRAATVKLYRCPSDRGHESLFSSDSLEIIGKAPEEDGWARGNYAANSGAEKLEDTVDGDNTHHAGAGLICVNWGASLSRISDGASNTIMFNEVRVGVNSRDRRGVWAMGMPGSSITCGNATEENPTPNNMLEDSDEIQGCYTFWYDGIGTKDGMGCAVFENDERLTGWNSLSRRGQARSRHPGGVNSCFADGSVRFVRDDIDMRTWRAMLTRDGSPEFEEKPYQYDF